MISSLLKERQRVEGLRQIYCPATQALHFLTVSMLLHWAAHYPPSSQHYPDVCGATAVCYMSASTAWKTELLCYMQARTAMSDLQMRLIQTQGIASEGQQLRQSSKPKTQQEQEQEQSKFRSRSSTSQG